MPELGRDEPEIRRKLKSVREAAHRAAKSRNTLIVNYLRFFLGAIKAKIWSI